MKRSVVLAVLALTLAPACAVPPPASALSARDPATALAPDQAAAHAAPPIAHFARVREGLYRGGHPDEAGLDYLASIGVRTIVDLEIGNFIEATPHQISAELKAAATRNITLVRAPMSAFELASSHRFEVQLRSVLAILADKAQQPIYVHCRHGQDRTGLVIGLERVVVEGWAPADAYSEMLRLGFHPAFIGLDRYFKRTTGYRG